MVVSLLVHGCATSPVSVEIEPPPAERDAEPRGHISTRAGRAGVVVAAPHGTCDPRTGEIASEIARRTGFGLVVATGFTIETAPNGRPLVRYHVNRPTEGNPGTGPSDDRATPAARRVYETYERHVQQTAGGPLRFYVEIHGNGRGDDATRIEIATVGVDAAHAAQLRTLFELTRDAHLRGHREAPRLSILVEPADRVVYGATGTKRDGILRLPERGLHIELPREARREFQDVYTVILAQFLAEAVALRPLK